MPGGGGAPAPYPQQQMPGGTPYPGQQMPPQQQQQQMPYGAPPMAGPGGAQIGGGASGMLGSINAKLSQIVSANQLQRFYPPQALQALASRLDSRVNFRELASRWGMPVELALDLAALALYDIVIVADGEMGSVTGIWAPDARGWGFVILGAAYMSLTNQSLQRFALPPCMHTVIDR